MILARLPRDWLESCPLHPYSPPSDTPGIPSHSLNYTKKWYRRYSCFVFQTFFRGQFFLFVLSDLFFFFLWKSSWFLQGDFCFSSLSFSLGFPPPLSLPDLISSTSQLHGSQVASSPGQENKTNTHFLFAPTCETPSHNPPQ